MSLNKYNVNQYTPHYQAITDAEHEIYWFAKSQSGSADNTIITVPTGETWRIVGLYVSGGCTDDTTARKFQLIIKKQQNCTIDTSNVNRVGCIYSIDKHGSLGLAGGAQNQIWKYNTSTYAWELIDSSINILYSASAGHIPALRCVSNTTAYLTTYLPATALYKYDDDAETITLIGNVSGAYPIFDCNSTGTFGIVGTLSGNLYTVTNDIMSTATNTHANDDYYSASVYSSGLAFAGGQQAGGPGAILYKWDGSSWTDDSADIFALGHGTDAMIRTMDIYSPTFGGLVSNYIDIPGNYVSQILHWDGTDWTEATGGNFTDRQLRCIRFLNENFGLAIGYYISTSITPTTPRPTYIYYWDGTTWTESPSWITHYPTYTGESLYLRDSIDRYGYEYGFGGNSNYHASTDTKRTPAISNGWNHYLLQHDWNKIVTSGANNISVPLTINGYITIHAGETISLFSETNTLVTVYGFYYKV